MHGKNFENFDGTDKLNYNSRSQDTEYQNFEFDLLFDKDKYKVDFTICKSILEYWTKSKKTDFFKSRYILKNWLLVRCQFYLDKYSGNDKRTTDSNKIESNNRNVKYLLEKLASLSLLESRPAKATNRLDTTEYQFTELGKLVALLSEFDDNNTRSSLVEDIYAQTLAYYRDQDYALAKFCEIFFTNCYKKDTRLFKDIVIPQLIQILKEPPNDAITVSNRFRNFQLFYKSKTMFIILINSLNECNSRFPLVFQKILYKLKFDMEFLQEKHCKNLRSFEELRFKNDSLYSVVLEGHCNKCRQYTPVLVENMTEYFKSLITNADSGVKSDCPKCESRYSLYFKLLSGSE
jgi:Fe-S-cluster formation regulator IscX/YfhJ